MMPRATALEARPPAFSPEMQGLMGLVGRALGLPSALSLDADPAAWDRLLILASEHRVVPLVYSGLKAAPEIAVPVAAASRFAHQANGLWRRSLMFSQELARLSRLLARDGIEMAALKGPGLSVQAYGSEVARAMRDLDILIRPEDFRRAQMALEAGGFACEAPFSRLPKAYQDIYLRSATHISFQHAALGYCLEVHLRPMQVPFLLRICTETLLAAVCPVLIGGTAVPVLAPHHHFLYVAAHGAKHGWWRLLWLADFAAFQRASANPLLPSNTESAQAASREQGLTRVLEAAETLCHLGFGSPLRARAFPDHNNQKVSTNAAASGRSARAIVTHGRRCLERGRQPITYAGKWDELFNLLRLRSEASYRLAVAKLYWDLIPDDFDTLSLLAPAALRHSLPAAVMTYLIPALRPVLWAVRRLPLCLLKGERQTKR